MIEDWGLYTRCLDLNQYWLSTFRPSGYILVSEPLFEFAPSLILVVQLVNSLNQVTVAAGLSIMLSDKS